jgi:UrcA family protein
MGMTRDLASRWTINWTMTAAMSGALAVAGVVFTHAPALAQPIEEMTVTAHPHDKPDKMSFRVGYADIDLRTKAGRDELERRVDVTAEYLCKRLGENDIHTCKDEARSDVAKQVADAEDQAIGMKSWKPGPAWTPPEGG